MRALRSIGELVLIGLALLAGHHIGQVEQHRQDVASGVCLEASR